ncbi:Lon-like protease helical domain-containing protein, partial [Fervidobacterium sp.]
MPLRKIRWEELVVDKRIVPQIESTEEVKKTQSFIGRERAVKALRFGLDMDKDGYNVFVVGLPGTGRKTFVKHFVTEYAQRKPVPSDVAYVMDFDDPQKANTLFLPAGKGVEFKKDMEKLVENLTEKISKVFEGEDYKARRREIDEEFESEQERITKDLVEKAQALGFLIKFTQTGVNYYPVMNGKVLKEEDFTALS